MDKVITVICLLQDSTENFEQVTISEHQHPKVAEALKSGYYIYSVTPTSSHDGRFVTLTFVLRKQ